MGQLGHGKKGVAESGCLGATELIFPDRKIARFLHSHSTHLGHAFDAAVRRLVLYRGSLLLLIDQRMLLHPVKGPLGLQTFLAGSGRVKRSGWGACLDHERGKLSWRWTACGGNISCFWGLPVVVALTCRSSRSRRSSGRPGEMREFHIFSCWWCWHAYCEWDW